MKEIQVGSAVLALDGTGRMVSLCAGKEELLSEEKQPLFRLQTADGMLLPESMREEEGRLCFSFSGARSLRVSCEEKEGYAVFRVEAVQGEHQCLLVGPIGNILDEVIGETIGVVQGGELALGIQALNDYTLAGFPGECEKLPIACVDSPVFGPSQDNFKYYSSAAYPARGGSLLQLYGEERRRKRIRNMTELGVKGAEVEPMEPLEDYDGSVTGMSFALFGCPREQALERIGAIELGEGLPHPMLDGQWAKTARKAMSSYLIAEFGTENLDKMLDYTRKAGFDTLYHPEPFRCWGHFELRPEYFPEGDESLAECCRRAAGEGIRLGIHTLTSFTTTNDTYVTPVPEDRLAAFGARPLTEDISRDDTEISLTETKLYEMVTSLQTVQIEKELITYQKVEGDRLVGCTRGAFGTEAAAHRKGTDVRLLCDYPYKVFFPDIRLQDAYTDRLVELFRSTGLAQISFDGLEGCQYTGEGSFAENRFCSRCWEGWNRPDLINDASRLNHNLWHMNTRMNWGEPWGEKMREGMLELRMRNQDFYRRNLFPRMLGWFLIRKANRKFEATTLLDMEWALSMAAGFDAGFALSVSEETLDGLGCTEELLEAIRNWEHLRGRNAFPEELREKLRDPKTEWHLERKDGKYRLYPCTISRPFVCDLLEMQPGQPGGSDWGYENPYSSQELEIRLQVNGSGEVVDPSFTTPLGMVKYPCRIKGGQYLICQNGKARRTDRNYRLLEEIEPVGQALAAGGEQHIGFACGFDGEEGPEVTVRFTTYGEPYEIEGD